MGLEFLKRVEKTSIAAGLVILLAAWIYKGPAASLAFMFGSAWSLANLHVLCLLVRVVLDDPKHHKLRIAAIFVLKVPLLYGAGYLLVATERLPVVGLLAGFTWPFAVVVLKAVGRIILGLDEKKRSVARSHAERVTGA